MEHSLGFKRPYAKHLNNMKGNNQTLLDLVLFYIDHKLRLHVWKQHTVSPYFSKSIFCFTTVVEKIG